MAVFPILNIIIFSAIALLHIYWAFGGKWAGAAVVPQTDTQKPVFEPGIIATLVVAGGLFGFAGVHAMALGYFRWGLEYYLEILLLGIAAIFLVRAVGDFNYVGFFKKKRNSAFARNDSKIYSPLCVVIFLNTIVTYWFIIN